MNFDEMSRMMGSVEEMKKEFIVVQKVEDLQSVMQSWENSKKQHWDNIFSLIHQLKEWSKEGSFSLEKFEDFRENFTRVSLPGMFEVFVKLIEHVDDCKQQLHIWKSKGAHCEELIVEKQQLEMELDRLKGYNGNLADHVKKLSTKCDKQESEIEGLKDELEDIFEKKEKVEKELKEILVEKQQWQAKMTYLKTYGDCQDKTIKEKTANVTALTKERDELLQKSKNLTSEKKDLMVKLEKSVPSANLEKLTKKCEDQAMKIEDLKNELNGKQRKMDVNNQQIERMRKEVENLTKSNQDLSRKYKELEDNHKKMDKGTNQAAPARRTQSEHASPSTLAEQMMKDLKDKQKTFMQKNGF